MSFLSNCKVELAKITAFRPFRLFFLSDSNWARSSQVRLHGRRTWDERGTREGRTWWEADGGVPGRRLGNR